MEATLRKILFAILALVAGPALAAPCAGFVDVDDSSPFCTSVAWIKNRGITLGCSANAYCPDANVSRLQMSAFLMRLGDALVPPTVLVVSPTGGAFHTIQAAINHAATIATPTVPVVIRVAPGTYPEGITLVPNVEVEGTSVHSTMLVPGAACVGPLGSAVVMAPYSRIGRMTIEGCNNGILFDGGSTGPGTQFVDTAIRDVQILQSATGINMVGVVATVGPIERTRISSYGSNVNVGIAAQYAYFSLSEVEINASGNTSATGLKISSGATGTLDRVTIGAAGPSGPNIWGIDALSGSLRIRDSTVGGISTAIRTAGTATVKVANSAISGTILGTGTTCFNNWNLVTLLPYVCP
jgi:hypothetical protein